MISIGKKIYHAFYANRFIKKTITNQFHRLYYHERNQTWNNTAWMGEQLLKCPFDLWVYQEMLFEQKPDFVIECGTCYGGSAFFMAQLMDLLDHGQIISIDIDAKPNLPQHDRITYLSGSSISPEIVQQAQNLIPSDSTVMVILDSDHSKQHVLAEMQTYSPMVTPGYYMVVEDSNINGYPVALFFGPGPMEAIHEFLATDSNFVIDKSKEKYYLTFNPNGYLKRVD